MIKDIAEINNEYNSNKHYIEQEFKNIQGKDRDSQKYLETVLLRILNNVDKHEGNKESIEQTFNYLEMKDTNTYSNDLADALEELLLKWVLDFKEHSILQHKGELDND